MPVPTEVVEPSAGPEPVDAAPDRWQTLKDVWSRDNLSGDWLGLRTDLHNQGIDIGLVLSQFYQSVSSGGVDTNAEWGGTLDYLVNVDATKLLRLWKGVSVQMHATSRWGEDVSADAGTFVLPNTGMLFPLPGDNHDTRITHLTITQSLFDGRVIAVAGKLNAIDMVTGFFPQVAYGRESFWNTNALASNLPWFRFIELSQWGGGAWTMDMENEMIEGGFLVLGQENVSNTMSMNHSFKDGVAILGWWRWFYEIDNKPGYFLLFGGGSTKDYGSLDDSDWHVLPGAGLVDTNTRNPWATVAYLYQVFWQSERDAHRHAAFFTGGTVGDDNPSWSDWNVFANVEAFGPLASRPNDRMGIAGWYSGLSDEFVRLYSDLGFDLRDTWGGELYYNIEINKWLHLTPNFQVVQNNNRDDDTAVISGVRLVVDF